MPTTVTVVSFNACGLPNVRPSFGVRAAEFCPRLDRLGADVVNLQEVHTYRRMALVRSLLPSLPHLSCARGVYGQPRGGVVTFSRYPVGARTYTSFARTMRHPRSQLGTALVDLRAYSKGVLVSEIPELGVRIANVHLSANKDGDWSAGNRYCSLLGKQLGIVRRFCDGPGRIVMTGDLNLAAGCALHREFITDGDWIDAFAGDTRPTFHPEFLPPGSASKRIDHVLVRGGPVTVEATRLLFEERVGGVFLSDHRGLQARVTVG